MDEDNYTSLYIKSESILIIRFKNPSTGGAEQRKIKRSIYRNTKINPDLLISAGTIIGNETSSQDMTNLERISRGKSPVIHFINSVKRFLIFVMLTTLYFNKGAISFLSIEVNASPYFFLLMLSYVIQSYCRTDSLSRHELILQFSKNKNC